MTSRSEWFTTDSDIGSSTFLNAPESALMNIAAPDVDIRGFHIGANVAGNAPELMIRECSERGATHHTRVVRLMGCFWLLFGLASAAPAQAPVSVETVLQVWKARQDGIRTVWIEYEQVEVTPKGMQPLTDLSGGQGMVPFPPEDLRLTSQWEFAIEGAKRRYAAKGMFVATQITQVVPQERVTATTGERTKTLITYDKSKDERLIPLGIINAGADSPDFINMTLWPCLAAYRPLQIAQLTDLSKENYDIRKNADVIDGVPCTLFSQRAVRTSLGPIRYLLWIDGSRNMMPLRIQGIVVDARIPEGRRGTQLDIRYEPSSTDRIHVKSWRAQVFADHADPDKANSGILQVQVDGTVTRIALNEPIAAASFEVEFPEGAMVTDNSTGGTQNCYALKGGGRRNILPAEQLARLTRDKILSSQPGELVPALTSKGSASRFVLVGILVVFVVAGGLVLVVKLKCR